MLARALARVVSANRERAPAAATAGRSRHAFSRTTHPTTLPPFLSLGEATAKAIVSDDAPQTGCRGFCQRMDRLTEIRL